MIAANLLAGSDLGRCVGVKDADVMNSRQFLRTSEDPELGHLHTGRCVYLHPVRFNKVFNLTITHLLLHANISAVLHADISAIGRVPQEEQLPQIMMQNLKPIKVPKDQCWRPRWTDAF